MSESTMGRDEHAKAVERRSVVEEKLRHDVREMLEVLKADIPVFFAREAKKRFVAAPELADRLSQEQLAKLKKDLHAAAEKTAAEVVELGRLIDESSTRERRDRLAKKWDEA